MFNFHHKLQLSLVYPSSECDLEEMKEKEEEEQQQVVTPQCSCPITKQQRIRSQLRGMLSWRHDYFIME